MALQIGTVDGLVNITPKAIYCFVNAIDAFSKGGVEHARKAEVALGTAFQRFVEPVYSGAKQNFDLQDIYKPAYTTNNKEQSPARVTFCKKMGLLKIDDINDIFELTPLGREVMLKNITIEEYAFILLSKQGIFINGEYKCNLLSLIAERFEDSATISDWEISDYIIEKFKDAKIEKTRTDIIVNALCTTGLISKVNKGVCVLSNTLSAEILRDIRENSTFISPSYLDGDDAYTEYMGAMKYGVFDIINNNNKDIYIRQYPNLVKYVNLDKNNMNTGKMPTNPLNGLRQQIFYGAPGTGKSNTIKKEVDEQGKPNVRTTFHPDSDYSTFVGAYKPTMKTPNKLYTMEELVVKLKEIKTTGTTYPCHKFAAKYWESLKDLSADAIKQMLRACDFTESMNVEISKGVAIGQEYMANDDEKIVYSFTPQAFLKAYTSAWKNQEEPFYLIIEEINRGNCAQIFGDLFQLLDRNENGYSDYPISPDEDIQKFLKTDKKYGFADLSEEQKNSIPAKIQSGEEMCLPNNLYIWATMNTSDQSLFPIDSAFKRRWDWVYKPIGYKNSNWTIEIGDKKYNWVDFQKAINQKIYDVDNSEDKQLGDYFVNADRTGFKISADTLLNKILFYIWNDVCKDDPDQIFRCKTNKEEESVKFSDFFGADKIKKLQGFMAFNGVSAIGESQNATPSEPTQDTQDVDAEETNDAEDNEVNQ